MRDSASRRHRRAAPCCRDRLLPLAGAGADLRRESGRSLGPAEGDSIEAWSPVAWLPAGPKSMDG